MPTDDVFDPAFLRSLEGLRILARRVPAGGRLAEQRSRARGSGVEFTDVRPYVPGDDFRAIDWHLYQRLDKIFLRLFLEDEDLPLYLLLDESGSMAMPPLGRPAGPTKSRTARQAVAALAYVAINHLDRVSVYPFAGEPLEPMAGIAGKSAFHRLLAWLAARTAGGTTGLAPMLKTFAHRRLRRGLCIVVSDFLDPAGVDALVTAFRSIDHGLVLVRIAHPGEHRPALHGELEIVDCEDDRSLAVHVDDAFLDRYERAYNHFTERLEELARSRHGHTVVITTEVPTVPQIAELFTAGALRT